jgi:hypothetical protein
MGDFAIKLLMAEMLIASQALLFGLVWILVKDWWKDRQRRGRV